MVRLEDRLALEYNSDAISPMVHWTYRYQPNFDESPSLWLLFWLVVASCCVLLLLLLLLLFVGCVFVGVVLIDAVCRWLLLVAPVCFSLLLLIAAIDCFCLIVGVPVPVPMC